MLKQIISETLGVPHGFPTRDGAPPQPLRAVTQVHGDKVVEAKEEDLGEADALWTQEPGVALGIKTADCVPLLLEDPVGKRVAAVHAGWRGAIAEIPLRALDALAKAGTDAKNVRAVIGPSIRPCCYEVDEALARRFATRFGPSVVERRADKVFLDIGKSVRLTLEQGGVSPENIAETGQCTMCDLRFNSYRRDHGKGRQVSYIVCSWPRGTGATTL